MFMLWFNFIPGLNFIFLCVKLIIIHYHTQKQREIKFKPRIKLNHNIYKTEWSPKLGERLVCRKHERKEGKEHDEYAVGTFIQESSKLVGHVPIELSFLVFTFLRAHEDNQAVVEVTGIRKLENDLVIPGTIKAVTRSR